MRNPTSEVCGVDPSRTCMELCGEVAFKPPLSLPQVRHVSDLARNWSGVGDRENAEGHSKTGSTQRRRMTPTENTFVTSWRSRGGLKRFLQSPTAQTLQTVRRCLRVLRPATGAANAQVPKDFPPGTLSSAGRWQLHPKHCLLQRAIFAILQAIKGITEPLRSVPKSSEPFQTVQTIPSKLLGFFQSLTIVDFFPQARFHRPPFIAMEEVAGITKHRMSSPGDRFCRLQVLNRPTNYSGTRSLSGRANRTQHDAVNNAWCCSNLLVAEFIVGKRCSQGLPKLPLGSRRAFRQFVPGAPAFSVAVAASPLQGQCSDAGIHAE